jgi:hypothetical protein
MRKIHTLAALILAIVILTGCDPASTTHPPSLTPPPSITPLPTPPPLEDYQKLMQQTVDTICLDVSQVELRGTMKETTLEFAAEALAANGFTAVAPGADCDATLVIGASFTGLRRSYQDAFSSLGSQKICYGAASASITWEMTFLDSELPPLALNIEVTYDPSSISNCATDEEDAPLNMAWIKAVATNLIRLGYRASVPGWTIPPFDSYRPR